MSFYFNLADDFNDVLEYFWRHSQKKFFIAEIFPCIFVVLDFNYFGYADSYGRLFNVFGRLRGNVFQFGYTHDNFFRSNGTIFYTATRNC